MRTLEAGKRIALSNILFATDFSPHSSSALVYAVALARQYGAKLYGAHVVSSEDFLFTAPDLWPAPLQHEGQLKEEVLGRLDEQLRGIPHEGLFGVGDVWKVLANLIVENEIDLLVVATHGRTGARKLLMGSIAEKIFRQASCPVLSVGPNATARTDRAIEFRHILFATNFGKESLSALPHAFSLAEENQAELTLLHVVEQPFAGLLDAEEVKAEHMRRLQQLVPPEVLPWCKVQCLVEFTAQFARPAERIVDVARDRTADLLVLGVRPALGRVNTVTHVTHTTAQHVVAHAGCPVLTVRA